MSKIIEPGDVRIKSFTLSNDSIKASINPISQLVAFDVYEDMTKPTVYATFFFEDGIGLKEKFPIIGEETITVEFETPGISKPTSYKFRCFEIGSVEKDPNGKGVTYVLRCVSVEHLYNGSSAIKQSYDGNISDMVPNILQRYLNSKKDIIIDETKGIQTIVVPRLNPLQTIDMLRQRAVSKEYPSSSYVFFENQSGFNFKTIEGLIKEGKKTIGSREFNAQQNSTGNKEAEARSYRTILDYINLSSADGNKKAAEGMFKAVTKTFDISSKSLTESKFDVQDVFNKFQKITDGKQIPNTDKFIEEFGSGVPKQFFVPKDTTRLDNFIDSAIATRNSFAVMLNSEFVRVFVHGDSGLKAGDLVTLNLPSPTGTTDKKKNDKMDSGNYLIVRLRHMITAGSKSKHQISFDCVKMGV